MMTPWYQTYRVAWPLFLGAAAVGAGAAYVRTRGGPDPRAELCPPGGRLEDVDYIELRTKGAAGVDQPLPMLIALHSRGMKPEQMASLVEPLPVPARVIVPVGWEEAGLGRAWTAEGSDDPGYEQMVADSAAELVNFVEAIQECRPTLGRAVVGGYSEGADMAYALATESPKLLAFVVGAGGYPAPSFGAIQVPTLAVHGKDDGRYPYKRTSDAIAAQVAAGAPASIAPMEGVGHSFAGALQLRWLKELAEKLDQASVRRV